MTVGESTLDETILETPRRRGFGQSMARWTATVAMGSWVVIGVVPIVVAICALR